MPARYRIRVRGIVDKSWSHYFGDLTITTPEKEDQAEDTLLAGQLPDNWALMGVLYRLYRLGFELISVEKMPVLLAVCLGAALVGYILDAAGPLGLSSLSG